MRRLPAQEQTAEGTIEYEFDIAKLLGAGDAIASVNWVLPSQLTLVNSMVQGTLVRGFIAAGPTAKLYESYWVEFTVNSVGDPTPVNPTMSFEISIVKRITLKVI